MSAGLEAFLSRILQEPSNSVLLNRFLVLVAELEDETEKIYLLLRLSRSLLETDSALTISLCYQIFDGTKSRHGAESKATQIKALQLIVKALRRKGSKAKAEIVQVEVEKLERGVTTNQKPNDPEKASKILKAIQIPEYTNEMRAEGLKIPEISFYGMNVENQKARQQKSPSMARTLHIPMVSDQVGKREDSREGDIAFKGKPNDRFQLPRGGGIEESGSSLPDGEIGNEQYKNSRFVPSASIPADEKQNRNYQGLSPDVSRIEDENKYSQNPEVKPTPTQNQYQHQQNAVNGQRGLQNSPGLHQYGKQVVEKPEGIQAAMHRASESQFVRPLGSTKTRETLNLNLDQLSEEIKLLKNIMIFYLDHNMADLADALVKVVRPEVREEFGDFYQFLKKNMRGPNLFVEFIPVLLKDEMPTEFWRKLSGFLVANFKKIAVESTLTQEEWLSNCQALLPDLMSSPLLEGTKQQLALLYWQNCPLPIIFRMLSDANLEAYEFLFWKFYIYILLAKREHRKILFEFRKTLPLRPYDIWIAFCWQQLPDVWKGLSVQGFTWSKALGSEAFMRRLATREQPTLLSKIV